MGTAWAQALVILLVAAAPAALTGVAPTPNDPPPEDTATGQITIAEALALDRVIWLDARPAAAYRRGHIPGALPLSEDQWETQLVEVLVAWNPGDTLVVYCGSAACGTSHEVAHRLIDETGLEPVAILEGGWQAYAERNP